jgi:hypothetical protein
MREAVKIMLGHLVVTTSGQGAPHFLVINYDVIYFY